jgi:hypothetical protein
MADRSEPAAACYCRRWCAFRSRAEDVGPWCSGEQRGPDRQRPQHVATGRQAAIPSVDDGLGLGFFARGPVRLELGDAGLDVGPAGSHPQRISDRSFAEPNRAPQPLLVLSTGRPRLGVCQIQCELEPRRARHLV